MPVRKGKGCVDTEMKRFGRGELHSGKSTKKVTNPEQAKAIALSVCGENRYAEVLSSLGFSDEAASTIVEMFAESFLRKATSSASSASFEEPDWGKNFETGKGPGPENPENYDTGLSTKKGRGQLKIGKGHGDMGKLKINSDSEMLSPASYPKGPGNPQGGSSKEVQGMRMLG